MKSWLRLVTYSTVLISIGCAKENVMETRLRTQAPKNSNDVGVVLEDAKPAEVETLLQQNPAAKVRVLNKEHGMYEIFGVSREAAQAATAGRATNNQYFQLRSSTHTVNEKADMFVKAVLDPQAGDDDRIGDLNPCVEPAPGSGPTAKLEIVSPQGLAGATADLGITVRVSGEASSTDAPAPQGDLEQFLLGGRRPMRGMARQPAAAGGGGNGGLKGVIAIVAPDASNNPRTIVNGMTAEFKPDAMGMYVVVLVVQDGRDRCAAQKIPFLITANRPYNGPKSPALQISLDKLWHLKAVQAEETWKVSQGEGITIAIVDSGVDYNHPTLAPQLKINEKEIADNKIDDDKNGFVDDVLGYDFVNSDAIPYDDNSHGTHVAGLAAARDFGLAPKAKILAVKVMDAAGGGDTGSIAAGVKYAVDRGARVINMSLGGPDQEPPPPMVAALKYAESKGVVVIVAAGNGDPETGLGFDIDKQPVYPASLPNTNLVCVAASDSTGGMSSYSNFGKAGVDVVAPGGGQDDPLISAAFENPHNAMFIGMSGTSMATPVVSGIAADILAANPRLTPDQVRSILINSGDVVRDFQSVTVSGRHLNALAAVNLAKQK